MTAELYIILGMGLFLVLHILTGMHEWRQAALNKFSLLGYRILFSVGTLYAFWTILKGFDARPFDVWWNVPAWAALTPFVLMPVSIFLLLCHFLPRSADSFSRQPLGLAIMAWAFSHLIANGESGTTLFFGGFLLYGALAIYLRERKAALGDLSASHGRENFSHIIPFTRWPTSMTGKKFAFLSGVTAAVEFTLVYIHEGIIGMSAVPTMLQ
jgi:uncharacterized membrane protein